MYIAANASPSYAGAAPSVLEGMLKSFVSGAVNMLGAVVSEAVVFGFVSEHFKTSESKVVVIRVKGIEAGRLA